MILSRTLVNKLTVQYKKRTMKKDTKLILEDYENCKNLYSEFANKCKSLIVDLLGVEEIKCHQITNRIKRKIN